MQSPSETRSASATGQGKVAQRRWSVRPWGSEFGFRDVVMLGIFHAVVDASTVTAVMRASNLGPFSPQAAVAVVFGYDVIAFGSQVFFGWLTDRYATPRSATLVGLVLSAIALLLYPYHSFVTMACAGIGNALFHLGAGAMVLGKGLDRAAPSGVFVAPGALGLGFGLYYGANGVRGPMWPLLALLVVATLLLATRRGIGEFHAPARPSDAAGPSAVTGASDAVGPSAVRGASDAVGPSAVTGVSDAVGPSAVACVSVERPYSRVAVWATTLLLVSIAVRSLVGMSAARGYARTDLLMVGLPLAAFSGKLLGGYLADRVGWIEASVAALLVAMPPIVMGLPAIWLLAGLFVFQMTMPVTLTAVARLLPDRLATAFGWTCLALIVGALPTMSPRTSVLCERPLLGLWIAVGALSLYAGLRLLGVGPRRSWAVPALSLTAESKT